MEFNVTRPTSFQEGIIAKWKFLRCEYEKKGHQLVDTPLKYYTSVDGMYGSPSNEHWDGLHASDKLAINTFLESVVTYAILLGIDPFYRNPLGRIEAEIIPEWIFERFGQPVPPEEDRPLWKYLDMFYKQKYEA